MPREMDAENLEIIKDFIAESRDILDTLDPNLMGLEGDLEKGHTIDEDIIHDIFRSFHSLKGAAGFLELLNIGRLTHEAESLLDLFRKGKAKIEPHHLDLFYQCGDLLKDLLATVEDTMSDDGHEEQVDGLVARFQSNMPTKEEPVKKKTPAMDIGLSEEDVHAILDESLRLLNEVVGLFTGFNEGKVDPDKLDDVVRNMGGVTGQLQILGHEDLSVAARKVGQLCEQIKLHKSFDNKHLMGLTQRLLQALTAAVQSSRDGKDDDFGPTLHILMDELLKVESGGSMSGEGESLIGETLVKLGIITRDQLKSALNHQQRPLGEILVDMDFLSESQLEVGLNVQSAQKARTRKEAMEVKAQNIRVDLNKLDILGNLVGELVIAENMVTHHESVQGEEFDAFKKSAQVLNRISREIQDLVMSLRMVPIHGTFQKMTRVARDVSHKLGKRVSVNIEGADTEIDKNVVEKLSSPLVHIVRNALDHGLEMPEERLAIGKDETGVIRLSAAQEGGEIVIRIADDGAGINKKRILDKAIERGIVDPDFLPENDAEIYGLIMQPGFSTASEVTEVSGRGVGMDVVKKNIEALQGQISIESSEGIGSTMSLRIPLTLSIIEGMLVRVGDAVLTIPLLCIRETLVVSEHVITTAIDGSHRIKIREELLPVVPLFEFYGFPSDYENLEEGILVVVEYGDRSVCLMVDDILGQRQTVIKRVSSFFGDMKGVSGFSILSNGDITMVLDISKLV